MSGEVRSSIIIGSGPAGYTAAVYLARAQLVPLVFAGEKWGGQLMLTTEVENYPGFKDGIMGPELMNQMRGQAKRFGAEIKDVDVTEVDFSGDPFKVFTGQGEAREGHQAKTVIIATGARSRMLEIGEERLLGRGVSTCAVCDAALYKEKTTFVVGGGDAAMEDALALLKFAKSVTLVHRRDKLGASKIMQRRVLEDNKDKVDVLWNTKVREVRGKGKLEAIVVENSETGEKRELGADGLFLAIGHIPDTEIFKGQVQLDQKGYLLTGLNGLMYKVPQQSGSSHVARAVRDDTAGLESLPAVSRVDEIQRMWLKGYPTMTSVSGVFGAGDVVDFRYRQAITAAGFGCMAALDVEKYLTGSSQTW